MRFVLVLGPLAIMKINCTVKYFSGFMFFGQKFKYCSVRTKKLHKMKVRKPKEKYSQSIMSCSTRDTSLRKFFTMTFVHTHHYFFKTFFPGILVLLRTAHVLRKILANKSFFNFEEVIFNFRTKWYFTDNLLNQSYLKKHFKTVHLVQYHSQEFTNCL